MQLYHLPTKQAAQRLEIRQTVLKKYARQFGIRRWPSRIIGSIQQLIDEVTAFQESISAAGDENTAQDENTAAMLAKTEAELAELRCAFRRHCNPQAAAQENHSSISQRLLCACWAYVLLDLCQRTCRQQTC